MTAPTGERLLSDYFSRLEAAALRLPPDRRADLLEGIAEHVAEARAAGELRDETAVRTLLDRLGEPEEIVAAAGEDASGAGGGWGPPPWGAPAARMVPTRPGTGLEIAAVAMLTVGSLLPVVGWLVGVALLWSSRRWRVGEKLLGTLVVPGGPGVLLLLGLFAGGTDSCTTSISGTLEPGTGGPLVEPGPDGPLMEPGAPEVTFTPPGSSTLTCESTGGFPGADLPGWAVGALVAFLLIAPFVVAVVLLRRARARAAAEPPVMRAVGGSPWTALEIAAVVLLGVGSFIVPLLGPLVGFVLAWTSRQWTTAEKVIATVLVLTPAVLLVLFWGLAFAGVAVGLLPLGGGLLLFATVFGGGPLMAAIYLAVVLSRRPVG